MKSYWLIFIVITLFFFSCENKNNSVSDNIVSTDLEQELEKATQYLREYRTDTAELILKKIANDHTKKLAPKIYIQAELNLGKIESDQGENVKALQHYQKAMETAELSDNKAMFPHIEKNIGILYVQWKQLDKALEYYDRAEKSAKEIGNEELWADCQNNKGIIYEQQGDHEKALKAYSEALAHYQSKNIPEKIAMAYSNMAIIYKLQKDYQKSVAYNLKAIDIFEKQQDKWSMAATYNNIGNLFGEMGNYTQAVAYCNKSLIIAKDIEAEEIVGMTYESLANAAAIVSDYKSAFQYQKDFSASMNKFINKENTQQLSELNIKYETQKKEKQIVETKLASRQKNILLILLGSAILISLGIFRNFSIKSNAKQKRLTLENELLEEQTYSKIQEQRLEISRDLHDSLGAQLTFINSIIDGLKNSSAKLDEVMKSKINTLSDFSENSIAELKNTLWVLNSKEINLDDLKKKILNFIKSASEAKEDVKFNFTFDVSENLSLNSKQAINLFRAVQEIINNALKYADASEIKMDVQQNGSTLAIQIADNGKGFDYIKEKNRSFGLTNIQNRILEVGGNLNIETSVGNGTKYEVNIKL